MTRRSVSFLDRERNIVATAEVELAGGYYSGRVILDRMPQTLRLIFERYEEIVNDQVFSLLDEVEDQVGAQGFLVAFGDGRESIVEDLQIFPRGGTVTFRILHPAEVAHAS